MRRFKLIIPAIIVVIGLLTTGYFILNPHYPLSSQQRAQLNKRVRLGTSGAAGFYMAIKYPKGETLEALTTLDDKRIIPQPILLGNTFTAVSDDILDTDRFTPYVKNGAAYVTYTNEFGNLVASATEKVVLRNPNASIFGSDGTASVTDMNAFFANANTGLVTYKYSEKDYYDGDCTVNLKLDGNILATNNFASDCSREIKSPSFEALLAYLG